MAYSTDTVAILGLGLIGGSLARALRSSGFSRRFLGYGHREQSLRRGVELGVIDSFTLDLDELLAQADIIVICTPTLVAADILRRIVPRLGEAGSGPVVTDAANPDQIGQVVIGADALQVAQGDGDGTLLIELDPADFASAKTMQVADNGK